MVFPIIITAVILPRINIINILSEDANIQFGIYDIYLADYSEDPELEDTYRFTIKALLDIRNGDKTQKLIIPRLHLNLGYLGKPVGQIWTMEELVLEPFINENSKSAGLLTLYITLYMKGESGIIEFINGMLLGALGAIEVDLTIYLGDLPIVVDVKVGELLQLLGGGENGLDPTQLLGGFGLGGGNEDYLIPEDYIFLKKNTFYQDIRAFMNTENYSIFRNKYDSLIFGAKDKFTTINWKNATNGNNAVGDGNYTWEYWNGNTWANLSINDGTDKFIKNGTISFSAPGNWESGSLKTIIENGPDFFTFDYYYIRCGVIDLDTGIEFNELELENSTFIRLNVKDSHIGDYKPPSSSQLDSQGEVKMQAEIGPQAEYPELDEYDLPLDKGLLKTDLGFDGYFAANGLDFMDLVNMYILPALQRGGDKAYYTPWVNLTDEDDLFSSFEITDLLGRVFGFLEIHEINMMQFLIMCEFEWEEIFTYIGENFDGWTALNGIDAITGEDIYAPLSSTTRYANAILYSFGLMLLLFILLGIILPYRAQKKVDQSFIFKDIKNLDKYMDKVKKEMEIGITKEEISLLKQAVFKEKVSVDKDKKEGAKK